MYISAKKYLQLFLSVTLIICLFFSLALMSVKNIQADNLKLSEVEIEVPFSEPDLCKVEENLVYLPVLEYVKLEKEVEVASVEKSYEFPFVTSLAGDYTFQGVCSCCTPNKQYSNMRGREGVTVFASSDVFAEGTLLWIEDVGIRQVQPITGQSSTVYVSFSSHEEALSFGVQTLKVYIVE